MSEHSPPTITPKARAEADERRRRQAEQLRANLARRKTQARARDDETAGAPVPATEGGGE